MKITIYKTVNQESDSISNFMDFYYSLKMPFLASDLITKGLSPQQIYLAINKAIKVADASGIVIKQHFKPIFSGVNQEIVHDCKLSKLAYGLVLMNADEGNSEVGKFQVNVLKEIYHM
tara:strand:+ start:35839 stop:36192 length:354 start_codon:yes stop_codon:yes gene_type:complete